MPAERKLVTHTAGRMSKGLLQPKALRTAATLEGINWMDAVFRTIRRQSSPPATPGCVGETRRRAACIPIGVAAFPKPNKLAHILPLKALLSAASFAQVGKTRYRSGRILRLNKEVMPVFSMRCPTPDHKHKLPPMEMAKVKPACAPWVTADPSELPENREKIMEITRNPVNIQLMTMENTPFSLYNMLRNGDFSCTYSTKNLINSKNI